LYPQENPLPKEMLEGLNVGGNPAFSLLPHISHFSESFFCSKKRPNEKAHPYETDGLPIP